MTISLLREEELDVCFAQLAECSAQQQLHISNNELPALQPNEGANSEAANQWWGVRSFHVKPPLPPTMRRMPALQASMLAEWICNIEAVCKAWYKVARLEGGSCAVIWQRLCANEFPMEAEPSRENYIRWRRAHLDQPMHLTPPLPDAIPSTGDCKLIFVFRQRSAPEDEYGGPIHFRTTRVVHHFERPLAYGPNDLFGEALILPLDEGANVGARCPVNPIPADIYHYAEQFGCRAEGVTLSISADVFLKRPDGKIAHLHHQGPFLVTDDLDSDDSSHSFTMDCDSLSEDHAYTADRISHLYPRSPVTIRLPNGPGLFKDEDMMVVPMLSFQLKYNHPADGVDEVDTAWIEEVNFRWALIETWGEGAGAFYVLRDGSNDPAVQTLQNGLPAAGGLEWR